jgi:AsmA-like C-terminal region
MHRLLIAITALLLTALLALLLALRSESFVLASAQWAVVNFTDLRLELRNPRVNVYRGSLSADEVHLIPKGTEGPALVSLLDLDVRTSMGDLLAANLLHSSLHASQLLIYVSENDEAKDPAPTQWLHYLGWLPEELRIAQVHLINASANTWIFPLKAVQGDRLERKHYHATAGADYEGEPLNVQLDLYALTKDRQITGANMKLVFIAPQTGSEIAMEGIAEGTSSDFYYDVTLDANYTDISEFLKGFQGGNNLAGALQVKGRMTGDSDGFVLSDTRFTLDNTPAYNFEAGGRLEYALTGESRIELIAAGELASLEYLIDWIDLDISDLGKVQSNIKLSGSLDEPVIDQFRVNTRNEEGLTVSIVGQLDLFHTATGTPAEENSIHVDIQGPSLATLHHWLEPPAFDPGPWRASALVSGNKDKLALSNILVEIGAPKAMTVRISGDIASISKPAEATEYAIKDVALLVEAEVPDAAELAPMTGMNIPPQHQLTARFRLQGNKEQLGISDAGINIKSSDLNAQISPITGALRPGANIPLADVAADIVATLSDTSALSSYTGSEIPSLGPVKLVAKLAQKEKQFQLRDIVGSVVRDQLNIRVRGHVGDIAGMNEVALSSQFSGVGTRNLLMALLKDFQYPHPIGTLAGSFKLDRQRSNWKISELILQNNHPQELLRIAVKGEINDLAGLPTANLAAQFGTADPLLLQALVGLPMKPLSGNLIMKTTKEQLKATATAWIGDTELKASGVIAYAAEQIQSAQFVLNTPHFHLGDLGFPYAQPRDQASTQTPRPSSTAGGDDKLQKFIAKTPRYPVDITVTVEGISGVNTNIDSLDIHLTGNDNRYTLERFSLVYDEALAEIMGIIDLNPNPPALSLAGQALAIPVNSLANDLGMDTDISGTLTLLGGVTVMGSNQQQLLQNLNGSLALALENAVIEGAAYDLLATDLLAWIYSGAVTEKSTHLDCTMAKFQMTDGVATTDSLYIESSRMVATGEAKFDLVKRKMDLTITPLSKSRILQVPSKVRLKGDMSSPQAVISPIAAAADASAAALMLIPNLTMKLFGLNSSSQKSRRPCQAEAAN